MLAAKKKKQKMLKILRLIVALVVIKSIVADVDVERDAKLTTVSRRHYYLVLFKLNSSRFVFSVKPAAKELRNYTNVFFFLA